MALFGRRRKTTKRASISIHLTNRLQPAHRHEQVEDPLLERLQGKGFDAAIHDVGTLLDRDGRILSCDIVIALPFEGCEEAFRLVRHWLVDLDATRGSTVRLYRDQDEPVGRTEGVILRVPGVDTVDFTDSLKVEHNRALDALIERLRVALGDVGDVRSWRVLIDDSDVYLYGPSGRALREAIAPLLAVDPLLEGAELIDFE